MKGEFEKQMLKKILSATGNILGWSPAKDKLDKNVMGIIRKARKEFPQLDCDYDVDNNTCNQHPIAVSASDCRYCFDRLRSERSEWYRKWFGVREDEKIRG